MDLTTEVLHWPLGVITSAELDEQELKQALVRGDNMMFTSIAAGKAKPRKRGGMTLVNSTPLSNSNASTGPAVIGGAIYPYLNSGTMTQYVVAVMANGDVQLLLDDGASTNHTPTASFAAALNANLTNPDVAVMNNRAFIQDGKGGRCSLKGTTKVDWGLVPVTGLALSDGGAGSMAGTYDVLVTGYNSQTGAESARSLPASITITNKKITVTVNAVANGLTHRFFRVYLQKPVLGAGYYRVLAGTGYNADYEAFPLNAAGATTSTTIDVTDAQLSDVYITLAPRTGINLLPPSSSKFVALYARRLFVADTDGLYWSELDLPDSFATRNYEPIKSRDPNGSDITGLAVGKDGRLHIFTDTARITLTGDVDVRGWQWGMDPDGGAVSADSIVVTKSATAWWSRQRGPVLLDNATGQTIYIGDDLIRNQVTNEALNTTLLTDINGTEFDGHILWAVPLQGKTRLTRMLSFNLLAKAWESTRWDPMDSTCIFTGGDTSKRSRLYLGNANGQLFRLLQGTNDGVRSGTVQGTFVASSGSVSTITDNTAAFDTTGAGLKERKVTVLDADGVAMTGDERPYITSNTGTAITLSVTVTGLTVGATYTYLIGGPDFVFETFRDNFDRPFMKKRLDDLYLEFRADEGIAQLRIGVAMDFDIKGLESDTPFSSSIGGLWDLGLWDMTRFDDPRVVPYRLRIFRNGWNYRIQIRNPYPDQGFTILKLGALARALSGRYRDGTA